MFEQLKKVHSKPEPFEFYTAAELWTDDHISKQMLAYHLDSSNEFSSRNHDFIMNSVDWIVRHFKITSGSKIADFGCGPGLYSNRLAASGARVTGVDFSKRSIDYASKEALKNGLTVDYVNKNYLEFETSERFDLIIMIYCDFCALSPKQRGLLLTKFGKFLNPGGQVLLDVYSQNAFEKRQEMTAFEHKLFNGFWSANDYYGFQITYKYDNEKAVLDKYAIVERDRTKIIYNWLSYLSREAAQSEFASHGFEITEFYADVAGGKFEAKADQFAIVARK